MLKQIHIGSLSLKEQRDCVVEVRLLASIDSPHVVRYYDSFLQGEQAAATLNIIMEYCQQGDLQQRLKVSKRSSAALAAGGMSPQSSSSGASQPGGNGQRRDQVGAKSEWYRAG